MDLSNFFTENNWEVAHSQELPEREAQYASLQHYPLSRQALQYLADKFPDGLYLHQKEAISRFLCKKNICLATSTASGKSAVFYTCAIEQLAQSRHAKILAIYPLRALGSEQEHRWREALRSAGIAGDVARIDGQVPVADRLQLLRDARVLIATPDVMHAWLLSNVGNRSVAEFLRQLTTIVVDEVHSYTGVFGSHAAFLFRRLQHILHLLGSHPRFIAASATIADPDLHLQNLFGVDFSLIDAEYDTSPRHALNVLYLTPPREKDLFTEVSGFVRYLARETNARFITFVDSRKQTEQLASIVTRGQLDEEEGEGEGDEVFDTRAYDDFERMHTLPYRAGYEEHDRKKIQARLSNGSLRGVISTSALELGLDIPHLDTCILLGVPRSATSLQQRIGRVGRHHAGTVLVINTGDILDETVFRNPSMLMNRPLAYGALYLQNQRIQYIHALCLARDGGEHDQIATRVGGQDTSSAFTSDVAWPEGFLSLCEKQRLGEIAPELQSMAIEAGEDPNHTFPLRDVESQFSIINLEHRGQHRELGSVSYSQMLREAYPAGVYYYITRPFRVCRIKFNTKQIEVRPEKRYLTKPISMPTLVFPNISDGNVFNSCVLDEMSVLEANLQIRESVVGVKERRGSNEFTTPYPIDARKTGVYFDLPRFTRNYFTTGVIITHPALNTDGVHLEQVSQLLFEAFFMVLPFERRDLNIAVDKHRSTRGSVTEGNRFLALYDQTYGSLRLSGHLCDPAVLQQTLAYAIELAKNPEIDVTTETLACIEVLYSASRTTAKAFELAPSNSTPSSGQQVILPGSKGLCLKHQNEEFMVDDVFYTPQGLRYRGFHLSNNDPNIKEIVPLENLVEIPGESQLGVYNYETGQIEPSVSAGVMA